MAHESSDITALIRASRGGNAGAFGQLVEAVYPELHSIALRYLRRQRADSTLQCTALIHEAYLRLAQAPKWEGNDRAHFFGVAAHVMRGILVDYARAKRTAKRGGGALTVALAECHSAAPRIAVGMPVRKTGRCLPLRRREPSAAQRRECRRGSGLGGIPRRRSPWIP